MTGVAALVLLAVLGGAEGAAGHTRSQSYSTWTLEGDRVVATWSILAREVTRLPAAAGGAPLDRLLAEHLAGTVRLRRGGAPCPLEGPPAPLGARPGHLRAELRFGCPAAGALEAESDAFFAAAPSHVHFARVRDGTRSVEHLFTDARRRAVLAAGAMVGDGSGGGHGASFLGYLWLGVEHILAGYDHIAFLLSLLLIGGRVRDVLFVVTGFTLGHSLTLSLAVLGFVRVDAGLVEALIGFSIALVAAENLGARGGWNSRLGWVAGAGLGALALLSGFAGLGPPWLTLIGLALFTLCYLELVPTPRATRRYRPAITLLFGLVHGFGFASLLMEIGLPRERLWIGLLGFNLGVELGQIAIVLALAAAARALRGRLGGAARAFASDVASAALCALGLFWFVARAYGG